MYIDTAEMPTRTTPTAIVRMRRERGTFCGVDFAIACMRFITFSISTTICGLPPPMIASMSATSSDAFW